MKIGISGSRKIKRYDLVKEFLDDFLQDINLIVHGDCKKGIDRFANIYAKENNIELLKYPAKWNDLSIKKRYEPLIIKNTYYGKTNIMAGKDRNHLIVLESDILIAFWKNKSKGTEHCFKIAKNKYKKPTIVLHINHKDEIENMEFFNINNISIYVNEKGGLF